MFFLIVISKNNKKKNKKIKLFPYQKKMSESEEEQIRLKQGLLKSEILDKNYDKDKFLQFCLYKKENGDDLSKWTFEELNEAINEFVKTQNENNQSPTMLNYSNQMNQNYVQNNMNQTPQNILNQTNQNYPQNYQQNFNPNQNINQQNQKEDKMNSQIEKMEQMHITKDNEDQNQDKKFEIEIKCKKLEKSILNDKEIKVEIKNPKASDKKFFEQTYITYEVTTDKLQWSVRRRFSDFEWLRKILVKLFPRNLIPPIPGKKVGPRRFEQDFIEKRMMFLQKFIDNVMTNENFKTSEALISFLSFIDRNQFEQKMKELTSYQPSNYVEDCRTLTGNLFIVDNEQNEKYYVNIQNYYKIQNQLFDRLNYNMKNFYNSLNNACIALEEAKRDFDTLHLLNARVLMKEEITKTYETLAVFFKNWKRNIFNQNEIIKSKIKDFFKYQRMESDSYCELIKSREVLKSQYMSEKKRLDARKEKLWQLMDVTKWEIIDDFNRVDRALLMRDKSYAFTFMCTKETTALEGIHKQLGYANKMNMEELKKLISKNTVRFVNTVKEFTNEFYPTLTDGISVWSTLNGYI